VIAFFDSHCHLADDALAGDLCDVVAAARETGVGEMMVIGLDPDNSLRCAEIARSFHLYFTAGVHPAECSHTAGDDVAKVIELLKDSRCKAIGEIGLDFYHADNPPASKQIEVFRWMLALASDTSLPVVIHQRNAAREVLEQIDDFSLPAGGVFHCFSGDWAYAEEVLSRGFHISVAGNVTYSKGEALKEVTKRTPQDRLLIETDAPYLTPAPYRGKRNEPGLVIHTAKAVAAIRGGTLEDVARATTENARRLFRIDPT